MKGSARAELVHALAVALVAICRSSPARVHVRNPWGSARTIVGSLHPALPSMLLLADLYREAGGSLPFRASLVCSRTTGAALRQRTTVESLALAHQRRRVPR